MLGKVLVVFQNENHKNASDASKPFSAAAGSNVFCRCFHTGIDWKVMAGAPLLAPLVRGWDKPQGCKTAPEGAGGCALATARFPRHL